MSVTVESCRGKGRVIIALGIEAVLLSLIVSRGGKIIGSSLEPVRTWPLNCSKFPPGNLLSLEVSGGAEGKRSR
jgi:hypothetical protein